MIDFDFDKYERECEEIKKKNHEYLELFETAMREKGLSEKTIRKHFDNIDFYINDYLLREEANPMVKGCYEVNPFLGYFFIRKCMWSTPSAIREYAASLKKFYGCMLENGFIDKMDYEFLIDDIKWNKEDWIEECRAFNDTDLSDDDFFDVFDDLF